MISIVGSGNAAWCLAHAFSKAGVLVDCIYARNPKAGKTLASLVQSNFAPLSDVANSTSKYTFLAVSDHALESVSERLGTSSRTIKLHVSGPAAMSSIQVDGEAVGVFYPLQTMRKGVENDFSKTPILIESSSSHIADSLRDLASKLSNDVRVMNSERRLALHTAAVWFNNFVNHINAEGNRILEKHQLPLELVSPLIEKTSKLALQGDSFEHQTGPAMRKDQLTIDKHLQLLDEPQKELYRTLTDSIQKRHEAEL